LNARASSSGNPSITQTVTLPKPSILTSHSPWRSSWS
jgi:hypothetical protein